MTIAEKILRAKTDYDEVYEAGKKSATESLKFVDIESQTYQTIVPTNVAPFAKVSKIGGISRKAENLIPFPYYYGVGYTQTTNGVTVTFLEDGGISVVGTPTKETSFYLWNSSLSPEILNLLQEGKRYAISGGKDGVVFNIRKRTFDSTSTSSWAECSASRPTYTNTMPEGYGVASISLDISSSITTEINTIIYPMLNEGATALPYEINYEGFRNVKVTELKSLGVNLIPFPYGIGGAGYTQTKNGLTLTVLSDGGISVVGTSTAGTMFGIWENSHNIESNIYLEQGETYTLSGGNGGISLAVHKTPIDSVSSSVFLESIQSVPVKTNTMPEGYKIYRIVLYINSGVTVDTVIYPMLNKGSSALPYRKSKIDYLVIPQAVQSLEGYGLGKSKTEYNYIDFENKKFKQEYTMIRLPSNKGAMNVDSNWYYIPKINLGISPLSREVLCNLLPSVDIVANSTNYGICMSTSQMNYVLVRKTEFTTAEEYAQWLSDNEVYIVERLATPIETDISAYLTDEYIEVESDGTITAENEYKYDVPTTISYLIES